MSEYSHDIEVDYTKKALPKGFIKYGLPLLIIGLIAVVAAYMIDPVRASFNGLISLMFIVSVGLGAIFLIALEYIVGAVWSVPFRRLAEYQGFIFLAAPIIAIPILLHMHDMYHWTHASAMAEDLVLLQKSAYLSEPQFLLRSAVIFVVMTLLFFMFYRNSRKQDVTKDQRLTKRNAILSGPFIILFAASLTIIAIDYLMSLEPHWFSTIFGVYYFSGTFLAAISVLTIIAVNLNKSGHLVKGLNGNHFYSLGGLMFAFTAFWTYIAFSQFMLIWYANLPEETFWYIPRLEGLWGWVTAGLIFIKFAFPFGLLITRSAKMNPKRLKFAAYWILFAHLYDLYWLIMPTYDSVSPVFGWMEIGFVVFSAGLVMVIFYLAANKKNLVAIGDPKIQKGIDFHL